MWWKSDDGRAAITKLVANGTFVVPTLTPIDHGAQRLGGVFAVVAPWTREITLALV